MARLILVMMFFTCLVFGDTIGFLWVGGTFTTVQDPLAPNATVPTGINDAGQIVGYYQDATGTHGFVDVGGTFTTIDHPLSPAFAHTVPYGINNPGQIVGVYDSSNGFHGFLDTGGVFTNIDNPSAYQTHPFGINGIGQIVGYYLPATSSIF
jgi:uncharacterized membrane protein